MPAANEVYVADGYGNRRVIVFDPKTGAYKRHWGAYGNKPERRQDAGLRSRRQAVRSSSAIRCTACGMSKDGLVYVCDRANDRIQVFRKDGTFVKEIPRRRRRRWPTARCGTSCCRRTRQQKFIFMADGANGQIVTLQPRHRRSARPMGPPRPPARPVQVGAQHRHRFQGQSLHRRGRLRPPRAEIQELGN